MKTKAEQITPCNSHRGLKHSIQASVILFLYCFQLFVAPWIPSLTPQTNSPKASQPSSLTSYPANPLTASFPKYVLKDSWNSDAVGQLNESFGNLKNPLQKMGAYDENAAAVRDGAETFVGVVGLGEVAATLAKNAPKILSKTEDIIKAVNQVYQDSSLSGKSGAIFPKGGGMPKDLKMTQWGWEGTPSWKAAAKIIETVTQNDSILEIGGKIPTKQQAIKLIEST